MVLIAVQTAAALLFISNFQTLSAGHWIAWFAPLILLLLLIVNSFWFTRFVSWLVFASSFFAFMLVLSAFTMRVRAEPGFQAAPFYKAIALYVSYIYVSLGHLKILGGATPIWRKKDE